MLRLGGGHAAGYDEGSVIVELITPAATIAEGIAERFEAGTRAPGRRAAAMRACPRRLGELAGEYCPGRWSVHAGAVKVGGTAQRTIRGASLLAAVVVVQGGDRLRAALVDVYAALELDWDPRTAGAAEDLAPGVTAAAVAGAVVGRLERAHGPLERAGSTRRRSRWRASSSLKDERAAVAARCQGRRDPARRIIGHRHS